jgi:chromosome segregation ATPase
MSDIVERLRADPYRNFTEAIEEIYGLRAEIERLRAAQAYSKETWVMQAKEIERLRGLVEECAVFLKEDETPVQRIERDRADTEAVLKLLLKEKRRTQKLQDKIDRWQGDAECLGRSLTERNAEIERLRGLLHECLSFALGAPIKISWSLWERVTNELGGFPVRQSNNPPT